MSRRTVYALGAIAMSVQLACSSATARPTPSPQEARQDTSSRRTDRDRNGIKPYGEVITEAARSDSGLFIVHWVDEKPYFEIPNDLLGAGNAPRVSHRPNGHEHRFRRPEGQHSIRLRDITWRMRW